MKLLIVESPTKAKKISGILKYLYPNDTWEVVASIGHLIDLPHDEIAVDVDKNFNATFIVTNKQALDKIVDKASKATEIYLGADADVEGEGIARRIHDQLLSLGKPLHRVRFNAITANVIKKAIDAPEQLDWSLAEAQAARRILDRIIGYKISPVLWHQLGGQLSAGRVQSCALKLLVDRTVARRNFKPEEFWQLAIKLSDGTVAYSDRFDTKVEVQVLQAKLPSATLQITVTPDQVKPAPPFTTAGLLQFATGYLRKSSKEVMGLCQTLFQKGAITYHRTESIGLAPYFIQEARNYIDTQLGKALLNPKQRFYPSKGAHEAIRPTKADVTATQLQGVSKDGEQLYRAIWARSLATQAIPADIERQHAVITASDGQILAKASGVKLVTPGWYQVSLNLFTPKYHAIDPNANIDSNSIVSSWTEPPQRYSESRLIRKLEKEGVGRPSTYATIVSSLFKHSYVLYKKGGMDSTARGELLTMFMQSCFPDLLQMNFTAEMEEWLDRLASGEDSVLSRTILLQRYWEWLLPLLNSAATHIISTADVCSCGKDLQVFVSRKGAPYLKCSTCGTFHGFDVDEQGDIRIFKPAKLTGTCSKCGADDLYSAQSQYGRYIRCHSCNTAHKDNQ